MTHGQERDRHLIEAILDLLEFLQENHLDISRLTQDGLALPDTENVRTAYEVVRFMDEMPGGFLIYYADGGEQIVYANQALLRIVQCDTMAEFRELTGNSFRGFVHPEDLEAVEESIRTQVAASQYDLDYVEYRVVRRDGAVRWIEDYGHYVRGETFRDIFYVFLSDATEKHERQTEEMERLLDEKRQGEQKLQDLIQEFYEERTQIKQEHLRRLETIEGLSINYESIFYVDLPQDQIVAYRMSSRSEMIFDERFQIRGFAQSMSNYVDAWVHPEDRELFTTAVSADHIREKLADSKTYYVNYRVLNGEKAQYLQLRVVNVSRQKQVSQIVMGCRSVDEEIQYEMEQKQILAEALSKANQAASAKNVFLSNMSHDMRTPLNAIFGFSNLAKRKRGDPEAVLGYLERIEASSRQLLELINNVLELSQAESGGSQAVETECDLCETVGEVFDFLRPQAEEKDIEFTLDCTGVVHKDILGDEEKLKQLIMYLANNAVTYTKPGGRVSITVSEQETLPNQYAVYRFTAEDTGIGISEEFLERLFEPFTREKNTTLSGVHGIGLGLTITKNLVDLMGGTIDVKSSPGEGSTFTVTLRFRIQPRCLSEPEDAAVPAAKAGGQSILLVEDNEINLEIETEILEELGFAVETAVNGSVAVEMMRKAPPGTYDLILMDLQMPVMDGWQAAQEIRRLEDPGQAGVPIIALSANIFDSDVRKSIESGMNDHLPKPLNVPQLLEAIEKLGKGRT